MSYVKATKLEPGDRVILREDHFNKAYQDFLDKVSIVVSISNMASHELVTIELEENSNARNEVYMWRLEKADHSTPLAPKETKTAGKLCDCPFDQLMASGCQCGGS